MNGRLCPYAEHEPQTQEGWQAWDLVVDCQGQLRSAGMGGVAGLDLPATLEMAQLRGYDRRMMAQLLPGCEAGIVSGCAMRDDDDPDPGEHTEKDQEA